MTTDIAIRTSGIGKSYGDFTAVGAVDLSVAAGTVFALLGPNGAGKTTTVRMLATLVRPDRGSAEIFGYDIARDATAVRSMIGLTGQYASVDETLTAGENLRLFGRLLGLSRREAAARSAELLDEFELTAVTDRPVGQFSGGMRRRLDLAATLITDPPRAATAYRDPATTPALQHLQPLQMILPRFVLHHFARTAKAPECLCTNLGETAKGVAAIGDHHATAVLMRPVVCTGDPAMFRRVEVGVNLSFSTDGHTVTLAVTGADPDRFPTRTALRALLSAEFDFWGLTPRFW
ncbi:ABC transporter ATP-binding protein [Nocardia sp. NPDC060259]|uniref:ABC transporter ATP-binding protein n=1 Tax=Nocardia sp. NPDC060259 TaxID=3347088 RepID=UPI0036695A6E